jgi:hypothetical protein
VLLPGSRCISSILLCLMLLARPALAQDRSVALIDADEELAHAIVLALSPWGVTARFTHEPSPGVDLPMAAHRAAALCQQLTVNVIVWVSASEQGSLLWIYDAETNEVITRELSERPPFSSPAAASVALSLKALLRTTTVAPPIERLGAPAGVPLTATRRFTVEGSANVRFFAPGSTLVYGAIGGLWWFRPGPTRLGAGLFAGTSAGAAIETADFSGSYRELSLSATLTGQLAGNRLLRSSLFGGFTAHFSELFGVSNAVGQAAESHRVVPSLDLGSDVAFMLGGALHLGLGVKASYLPRPQRYLVQGETVLSLWPIAAELGIKFGIDL